MSEKESAAMAVGNVAGENLPENNTPGNLPETPLQKVKAFMQKYKVGEFFQKYTMMIALVVVVMVFYFWEGKEKLILMPANVTGLLTENAYVFVLATGMLLCILTGGNIDLSVGSVLCFAGGVGCILMKEGYNMWIAVIASMLIGMAVGAFQGFWIAKVRVPAFIATLAGMYAFRGLSNTIMQGQRVIVTNKDFLQYFGTGKTSYIPDFIRKSNPELDKVFTKDNEFLTKIIGENFIKNFNVTCFCIGVLAALIFIGFKIYTIISHHKLGIKQSIAGQIISMILVSVLVIFICFKLASSRGFPWVAVWVGLILGIYAYVTNKTAIGRHLYAVGGNEKATALSGVKTRNVYWFAYANIGLLAGFAGILGAGRGSGIEPVYGEGFEMDAIASCFIGGASAYGGTGKVSGMIIGALLMGVINKGLMIVSIPINYRVVIKGAVLLIAVMFDVLSKRQKQ